jgi:hypothetical protein
VFEQKKIGCVVAGDANEARVEKLNQALHFVVVAQPDADWNFIFDQIAQVLYFFEGLLRGLGFRFAHGLPTFTGPDP